MRFLFRLLGAAVLLALPAPAGSSPPKVIFRVFVQTSAEGLPSTQARQITVPPDNESITIRALPELSEADLVDVHADASGNVHFMLDHRGQVDLDAVTAQNPGRILVVTLNGYVLYAPIIDQQISNGELIMPHPLDPAVIELLEEEAKGNVKESQRQ